MTCSVLDIITHFDFDSDGRLIATVGEYGTLVVADVGTNSCSLAFELKGRESTNFFYFFILLIAHLTYISHRLFK